MAFLPLHVESMVCFLSFFMEYSRENGNAIAFSYDFLYLRGIRAGSGYKELHLV